MDWTPLWNDGPVVASHALAALAALGLGGLQLALPKGGAPHRVLGRVWVALIGFVALGSFAIHELRLIGPFSPIHLLSILTLVSLTRAILAARAGRIEAHRKTMVSLYGLALVLTGAFTLLPGRTMHAVLFGAG